MSLGLVGRKIGMTRIFSDDGAAVPVTVLDVANNRVTQIKTEGSDGYSAVQVTYGKRRANRVTKPQAGHLAKAGVEAGSVLKEFQVRADELASLKLGEAISVETFAVGQLVDVSGTTKGRGFSGVIQRHHFSSNRASKIAHSRRWKLWTCAKISGPRIEPARFPRSSAKPSPRASIRARNR